MSEASYSDKGRRPRRFAYRNGAALAPLVALNETVLAALIREHYERVTGAKCDRCTANGNLWLVRRDGRKRKRGVYGLADIVNAGKVVGGELVLPSTYTLRCRRCAGRMTAALKKAECGKAVAARRRQAKAADVERPDVAATVNVARGHGEQAQPSGATAGKLRAPAVSATPVEREPEVARFVAEMPAAAASIERQHGSITGVLPTYNFQVEGRPPVVAGWIVSTSDGQRLRVPLAEAA